LGKKVGRKDDLRKKERKKERRRERRRCSLTPPLLLAVLNFLILAVTVPNAVTTLN
jgi:hypothetical protein